MITLGAIGEIGEAIGDGGEYDHGAIGDGGELSWLEEVEISADFLFRRAFGCSVLKLEVATAALRRRGSTA